MFFLKQLPSTGHSDYSHILWRRISNFQFKFLPKNTHICIYLFIYIYTHTHILTDTHTHTWRNIHVYPYVCMLFSFKIIILMDKQKAKPICSQDRTDGTCPHRPDLLYRPPVVWPCLCDISAWRQSLGSCVQIGACGYLDDGQVLYVYYIYTLYVIYVCVWSVTYAWICQRAQNRGSVFGFFRWRSFSKCYAMDCFDTYFPHAQTCDVTRVQSATDWTASVHTSHMPKPVM